MEFWNVGFGEMRSKDWDSLPPSESTQKMGQKWIEPAKHAILKIPSTLIKEEHNFLINPAHPDFSAIEFGKPQRFGLIKG